MTALVDALSVRGGSPQLMRKYQYIRSHDYGATSGWEKLMKVYYIYELLRFSSRATILSYFRLAQFGTEINLWLHQLGSGMETVN